MEDRSSQILNLLQEIMDDRGVPRNIKTFVEDSLGILNESIPEEEKITSIISVLDEVSGDPNLSSHARTRIWSTVSILEGFVNSEV